MPKRITLIGIPLDHNSSYLRGPPPRGRTAWSKPLHCDSANLWTETGHDLSNVLDHAGTLDLKDADSAFAVIEEAAAAAGAGDATPIFLGGDHSVTYPLVRA